MLCRRGTLERKVSYFSLFLLIDMIIKILLRRGILDDDVEGLASKTPQMGFRFCDYRRCSRSIVEQSEFAEGIAWMIVLQIFGLIFIILRKWVESILRRFWSIEEFLLPPHRVRYHYRPAVWHAHLVELSQSPLRLWQSQESPHQDYQTRMSESIFCESYNILLIHSYCSFMESGFSTMTAFWRAASGLNLPKASALIDTFALAWPLFTTGFTSEPTY